jgi:hypothetical protein
MLVVNGYLGRVQMDFKEADSSGNFKLNHYHQNYGYDLEAALYKHPIKELDITKFKSFRLYCDTYINRADAIIIDF